MSLNWKEIDLILQEWNFTRGKIQQIIQPTPFELYLEIYPYYEDSKFTEIKPQHIYINLSNSEVRLHTINHKVKKAKKTQRFQQLLHSRILGAKIMNISHVHQDRIVKFEIAKMDDSIQDIIHYNLYIKLWSNQSNIILTTKDNTIIDLVFRRPTQNLKPGEIFVLPEKNNKNKKKEVDIRIWEQENESSFNEYIDDFYTKRIQQLNTTSKIKQLEQAIRKQRHVLELALDKIHKQLKDFSDLPDLKLLGDLILSNAHKIEKGQAQLLVEFEGSSYIISLDKKLDAYLNAEAYFKKSKKSKRSIQKLKSQESIYQDSLSQLDKLEADINSEGYSLTPHEKKLLSLDEMKNDSNNANAKHSTLLGKFVLKDKDYLFILGRNLKENDDLLRHHIKGKDIWLHVRGNSGAYVFIRSLHNKSIPLEKLIMGGQIAALYSKVKHEAYADIYYTEVKYLKRVKNAPGVVNPIRSKNLQVKINILETKKYIKDLQTQI